MKTGLVLEGGAMRGMFTAGILDVFMENGITFDGMAGVSAGAAFGCNLKSGQRGRAIRYNLRFANNKEFCSIKSLIKTGDLYGGEFCYHTVPDKLDIFDKDAFEKSPMKFYVVCTDVETGKAVYHDMTKVDYTELEWMRASGSLPLAAKIVEVNGRKLLDGGIADSIPLLFMEKQGYDKNLVILTRPRDYVKQPTSSLSLIKLMYRKYPELIKAVETRHKMYNNQLKYVRKSENEGKALVLAPDTALPVKRVEHDTDALQEAYRIGRKTAMDNLEKVKAFISE